VRFLEERIAGGEDDDPSTKAFAARSAQDSLLVGRNA
jgi:hypothetical protein